MYTAKGSAGELDAMSSLAVLRLSLPTAAIVSFATLCAPVVAWAQQSQNQPASKAPASIPADVTDKLASDLAKFQANIQSTQQLATSSPVGINAFQQFAASSPVGIQIRVTSDNANVLSGANASAPTEFVAKKGEKIPCG